MGDQAVGYLSPWLRKKRVERVTPYLQGKVLDYGCGFGELARVCDPEDYLGLDLNEAFINIARDHYPQFTFVVRVPDGQRFDTIVALALIEHIPDPAALLKAFQRMLKPKGRVVITTPHPSIKWVHAFGSRLRLFSAQSCEEHKQLIDYRPMKHLATEAGL